MDNDESNYFNLITYENIDDNNNSDSEKEEELDCKKNLISKSDHLKHSKEEVISEKIKKI